MRTEPKLALVPVFVSSDPPMGLGSIATYLKIYAQFTNTIILDEPLKKAIRCLEKEKPDIIGLSAMTMHYSKAILLAKIIRNNNKLRDTIIIIGGVHISTLPESLHPAFDLGVLGEGEQTMLEIIELYRKGRGEITKKNLANINGLAFYKNSELVITLKREMLQPVDRIPIVDRSFFAKRYFKKTILNTDKAVRMTWMLTSRGCPYKCRFCSTSRFWQMVRVHSVMRVVDEIEYLISLKIQHISISDDIFMINKQRLKEIIEEMQTRGLLGRVKFNASVRANLVDDDICKLANQLGVVFFSMGFESGSDRMLKYLKKDSVTVADNKRSIRLCHKYKIQIGAALIIASPTETVEDMEKTIEFIRFMKKYPLVYPGMSIMVPHPGTEMWDVALQRGKVSNDMEDWGVLSYALLEPLLLDEEIPYEMFMECYKEARKEIRYSELRRWARKFVNSPFFVLWIIISDFKFLKFFSVIRKS